MKRTNQEAIRIQEEIETIPIGDPEIDHTLLDTYTLETLKLLEKRMFVLDQSDDLSTLLSFLIQKWETIEELWYS